MNSALRLSSDALRWALQFYARHFWLVAGLSLIPTAQRFMVIRYGDTIPTPLSFASEVVTAATRLLLVVLIVRLMVAEPPLDAMSAGERWHRLTAGMKARQRDFLLQFVVLALAFVVLDVIPEFAIATWIPAERQNLATALLVGIKNPTVIAMTILWLVGIGQMLMKAVPASVNHPQSSH